MADFAQGADTEQTSSLFAQTALVSPEPSVPAVATLDAPRVVDPSPLAFVAVEHRPPATQTEFPSAQEVPQSSAGFDWFDDFHVVPRSFDFGNVLSDQSSSLEVFSAHRHKPNQEWSSFTNNAGAGTVLSGLPSLPTLLDPLSGIIATLEVSATGVPFVDSTLVFTFSGDTIAVAIEIQRIVLFALRPENDYEEALEWRTNVLGHKVGTEQRPSVRKNPRQFFGLRFVLFEGEEGDDERGYLDSVLFDWQSRVFGIPVWHEETALTAAATAGDTVISVQSTDFADYRVGSLMSILTDRSTFDVVPVASFTASTITLESPLINSYPIGASVFPTRTAHARATLQGGRSLNSASGVKIDFRVTDNDVPSGFADLTPFDSFDGKLLLGSGISPHIFSGPESNEVFERQITVIDNETGAVFQDSDWDRGRNVRRWSVVVGTREALWQHRRMLHAIRGRQIAWYLPAKRGSLRPVLSLASGSDELNISNIGYTQFVRSRQPMNVILVTFNNGDPALTRTVLSSVVVDSTRETLTLDGTWPSTYAVSDVERIEYVQKVRFDADRITLRHFGGGGHATRIAAPIKTVLN